jgi:hypothetical protein
VAGHGSDERGIERRSIRRNEQWTFIAVEIIRHYKVMRLIGDNQIPAVPLVMPREEKVGVGNSNGGVCIPRMWKPTEIKMSDRKRVCAASPDFAGVIHEAPKNQIK